MKTLRAALAPLLVLLTTACAGLAPAPALSLTRVLLDTDANNELDDQHAIAYMLFSGDAFDVEGITVNRTRGGGDAEQQAAEAERIVKLAGLRNAHGLGICQVVPYPYTPTLPVVREYQDLLKRYAPGQEPNYTSFDDRASNARFAAIFKRIGEFLDAGEWEKAREEEGAVASELDKICRELTAEVVDIGERLQAAPREAAIWKSRISGIKDRLEGHSLTPALRDLIPLRAEMQRLGL